ncbi:MAG: glycosyltransferase family 39 protein [Acidimicrobiales bacterium]
MTRRISKFWLGLCAIVLVGVGIRFVSLELWSPSKVPETVLLNCTSYKVYICGDAVYYHEAANLLADGKGFMDPYRYLYGGNEAVTLDNGTATVIVTPVGHEEPTAGHPPMYVLYLGAFSALGLQSLVAHQIASIVLGSASVLLAGLVGRSLRNGRTGLIAAFLTAVYANIWLNDTALMSETAAVFFVFVSTFFGLRFVRESSRSNAALFGIAGALAALSRAELLLFLPIVAAVALWKTPIAWRERFLRYAIAGVVCCAVLAPWVIRNNLVMEEPITLSDGTGTVLVQANCDDTYYGRHIGYWSFPCGGTQPYGPNGELLDESQRDVVVRQRATEYISNHTTRLLTVVIPARIGRMWGLYEPLEQVRLDINEGRPSFPSKLGFLQYLLLAPSALAGAVIQWRRRQPLLVIGLWAVLATVTAAIAFGNTRYRIAAEVSIVLLASIAFEALWSWSERKRSSNRQPDPETVNAA